MAKETKQAVIVLEPINCYCELVSAIRGRVEGSDTDYIRIDLTRYTAKDERPITVFVNDKFFEKTAMQDVVTIENNSLVNACISKPVTVSLIDIPADGNTYGYLDRDTNEYVPYEVVGRKILTRISGVRTEEVAALPLVEREAIYDMQLNKLLRNVYRHANV